MLQKIENYQNAVKRLEEAIARYQAAPDDTLYRDGLIQRFEFTFELAAHGKTCLLAEEVLAEVHFAVVHRNFGEVECRHLEHVACTFCVRLCNERSMEIYESLALEERVDGKRHGIPDSENGTESVGSQPHVSNCSQIFE